MERSIEGYALATLAVVVLYAVAACVRGSANPLVITQGAYARASLSKLQLFFFTLAVIWVAVALLTWTHKLAGLSADVVVLLGIGAAGTTGGKLTAVAKRRLDFDNWAWLVQKGWIEQSIERGSNDRTPEFSDLLRTGDEFDVGKFQLFAFSLVVGAALIYFAAHGADVEGLAEFEIPGEYLSLIGLSQVAYIGGKAVNPSTVADLNKKLTKVRGLETEFIMAVEQSRAEAGPAVDPSLQAARTAAPEQYHAYRVEAEEAATMVGECIGKPVTASIEPAIPDALRAS